MTWSTVDVNDVISKIVSTLRFPMNYLVFGVKQN